MKEELINPLAALRPPYAEWENPYQTYQRLLDIVKRITYKPGWKLHLMWTENQPYYVSFFLRMQVPDLKTQAPINLQFAETAALDFFMHKHEDFILRMWIYPFILKAEEHELREWFKVDGKHFIDPHPEAPKF